MARILLLWEQRGLTEATRVALPPIKALETMPGLPAADKSTIQALRLAMEGGGVSIIEGETLGVQVKAAA